MTDIVAGIRIRALRDDDLPAALRLTQALRWSHRREDWDLHFRVGRGYAATGDDGALIGTIMWWPYGDHFGCVGLVVVDGAAQGRGIGRALMDVVIADCGSRSLQLVSTEAGLRLYQQCGFLGQGGIEQHLGVPDTTFLAAATTATMLPAQCRLRAVTGTDFNVLCGLDRAAIGADRSALLRELLRRGGGTLVEQDGRPVGFALHRPAGGGTTVGPIVAGDDALAIALLTHELRGIDHIARVDALESDPAVVQWLTRAGMPCVDRVTRMLRGDPPPRAASARLYGLVSQALG